MNYGDKWLGKFGGGFSASVIGGGSAYQANVWNMASGNVPMPVLVTGKRLGLMSNAEAGHAIILVTGVPYPEAFSEIKSSGIDWVLSIGGKADAAIKTTSKAGALLEAASKAGNWAAQESAKKAVQGIMGDFELPSSKPGFILLPTPAAVGVGIGIFYEWQTLVKVGSDVAWRYIKPNWWLQAGQNNLLLHMDSIPEKDNQRVAIHLQRKVFGSDDILLFNSSGRASPVIVGIVKNGRLHDSSGSLGINLSAQKIAGVTEIGMLSTTRKAGNFAGEKIYISVNVATSLSGTNLYKWQSKDYAAVQIDATGKMASSSDLLVKT